MYWPQLPTVKHIKETGTPNGIADYYLADIATVQNYYPFGMVMPGRNWTAATADGYGFGAQGSLKQKELNENNYSTFYRELDTRVAKWYSMDSKTDAKETPYAVDKNNPILFCDPKGDWPPGNGTFNFVATMGFSITLSKQTTYGVSAGIGAAVVFPKLDISSEFSALGNLVITPGAAKKAISGGYSASGMVGVGNPLNMAGFATTGFVNNRDYSFPDFSSSAGSHFTSLENPPGNDFIGGGLRYTGGLFNTPQSNDFSIIGRGGLGVNFSDEFSMSGSGSTLAFDVDRKTKEFGFNLSYSIGSQPGFGIEATLLYSHSTLGSEGVFFDPVSVTTTNTKTNMQFGLNSLNNKLSLDASITGGGLGLHITGNLPSIQNLSLRYSITDKKNSVRGSGVSGAVGGGISPGSTNVQRVRQQ